MVLKICAVVYTHDDLRTISEVVRDIVLNTPFPVLVVDDGSTGRVADFLYSFEVRQALELGRVRLLRSDFEKGKGPALQTAIQTLASEGFTHILTVNGRGAQLVSEAHKLVEAARLSPWDVILGYGTKVSCWRSDFRIYPLFLVQNLNLQARADDFEIEILVRLIRQGVKIKTVKLEMPAPVKSENLSIWRRIFLYLRLLFLFLLLRILLLFKKPYSDSTPFLSNMSLGSRIEIMLRAGLKMLLPLTGLRVAYVFLKISGPVIFLFSGRARRALRDYYRLSDPKLKSWQLRRRVYQHWLGYQKGLTDQIYQESFDEPVFSWQGHGFEFLKDESVSLIANSNTGSCKLVVPMIGKNGFGRCHDLFRSPSEIHDPELIPVKGKLVPVDTQIFKSLARSRRRLSQLYVLKVSEMKYEIHITKPETTNLDLHMPEELRAKELAVRCVASAERFMDRHRDQWVYMRNLWSEWNPKWRTDSTKKGVVVNKLYEEFETPTVIEPLKNHQVSSEVSL